MNILIDELPEKLDICGTKCEIRTDFKTWLKVSNIISDCTDIKDRISDIFKLIFYKLPPNFYEALLAIMDFYSYQSAAGIKSEKPCKSNKIYDFSNDADLIYSAFLQQYKIDLTVTALHWWQFKTLLNSLTEDTQFVKVLQYRNVNITDIKDKEQKKFYLKMKRIYKLPDGRTEAQKENDFNSSFADLFI